MPAFKFNLIIFLRAGYSLLVMAFVGTIQGAENERKIWERIGNLEVTLPEGPAASASERLQQAIRLIGNQPRTTANLASAKILLAGLANEDANPELAAAGGYYQARILQWEQPQPKPIEAAERYLVLAAQYPGTFHAELGLLRAVPIFAYVTVERVEVLARLQSLTALSHSVTRPMIRRNIYSALSEVYHRLALSPQKAAELAAAAAAIPFDHRGLYASTLLAAATRANTAGNRQDAREFLVRFLADFPDDLRAFEARQLLNEWGGTLP